MITKDISQVDAHCHVDLYPQPQKIIDLAEQNSNYTIAVTNTPSVYSFTESITNNSQYIRPAIGFHPELVVSRRRELPLMWEFLVKARYTGVIGLDYQTKDEDFHKMKKDVFE